ncbi:hypothetical protein ACH5RR_014810 [Cinchona calisaya]|uniref:Uncharacterized protein n=1 Tax=Cinchona calisaya TaxID=153742 RepID=A0ABD2ZRC6_9GENT
MVWHIATILCEIEFAENLRCDREVAADESKYCAYVRECIFREIVEEANEYLKGCKTMETKSSRLKWLAGRRRDEKSVIVTCAKLAKQLIQEIQELDRVRKILGDFWTEMVLFVAPSDDVTAHV